MNDADGMRLALEAGRRGLGVTSPNPAVGAVLVRDGAVLGVGHTQPPGGAHAEVQAIAAARAAGHDPRGATMYVTLEPCCHHGRTPPCTDAILAAGVARVVVGVVDPFEPMQGRSLALLASHGVEVRLGVLGDEAADAMRGFLRAVAHGLPEVNVKVAGSADGHLAAADGSSRWISGPEARAWVHEERARHDAVLVGVGTALADDPSLDVRGLDGAAFKQPVPVVLDSGLRLLRERPSARLLGRASQGLPAPVVVCADDLPDATVAAVRPDLLHAVRLVRAPRGPGGLDVTAVLRSLARLGLHRVLVEGGAQVVRSLLDAGVVDRVHLVVAGLVLPGGRPWVAGPPVSTLTDAARWGRPDVATLGDDVRLTWTLIPPAAPGGLEG